MPSAAKRIKPYDTERLNASEQRKEDKQWVKPHLLA
jgi:hypothetical protein